MSAITANSSIKSFLRRASLSLSQLSSNSNNICMVLGNEAADADSIVSSLCLAYMSQRKEDELAKQQIEKSGQIPISYTYVPLICTSRRLLNLRRETEILLNMVDLNLNDLICLDDVDIANLSVEEKLKGLILVDHNKLSTRIVNDLQGGEKEAEMLVSRIVDHHLDNKQYLHLPVNSDERNIAFDEDTGKATAGSTCTLVAEELLMERMNNNNNNNVKKSKEEGASYDMIDKSTVAHLCTMMMGVICIDTQNLDTRGAGTSRDAAMLESIDILLSEEEDTRKARIEEKNEQMSSTSSTMTIPEVKEMTSLMNGKSRTEVFETLRDAKMDLAFWASLSTSLCLESDYKEYDPIRSTLFGMSSICAPLQTLLEKEDVLSDIKLFMNQRGLDSLTIMSFVAKPALTREIMIVTRDIDRLQAMSAYLASSDETAMADASQIALKLTDLALDVNGKDDGEDPLYYRSFSQENIKASRKQVAPLINRYYTES